MFVLGKNMRGQHAFIKAALLAGTAYIGFAAMAQAAETETVNTVVASDSTGGANDAKSSKQDAPSGNTSSLVSVTAQTPAQASFRIRGVGPALDGLAIEPDVGVIVDGVVMARGLDRGDNTSFSDYPDLASGGLNIGPQGFDGGKNTVAGTIIIQTLAPTDHFTGKANVTIGEAGEYHESGTISGPITDNVLFRLSAYNNNVPGYIHSTSDQSKDFNGSNSWGLSGKVLWHVNPRLDLTFKADYRNTHGNCCVLSLVSSSDEDLKSIVSKQTIGKNNRYTDTNIGVPNKKQAEFYYVKADYNLGSATIQSITSWQNDDQWNNVDVDNLYTPTPIYTGGSSGNYFGKWDYNMTSYAVQQVSEDLKIASNDGAFSRFAYVFGINGLHTGMDQHLSRRRAYCSEGTLGEACDDDDITWQSNASHGVMSDYRFAAYGKVSYQLTQKLKATGGMRVDYEHLYVWGKRTAPSGEYPDDTAFSGSAANQGEKHASDVGLSGTFKLDYSLGAWGSVFADAAHGYKGIGMSTSNNVTFATQNVLEPETVNTFELGYNGHTPDKKYMFSLTLFQSNYENMQVQASRYNDTTGAAYNEFTNAGTARTRGFELNLTQKPFEGLSIHEGVTFTEAVFNMDGNSCPLEYQSGAANYTSSSAAPSDGSCYTVGSSSTVMSNTRKGIMNQSPKWQISVAPRYEHLIPGTDYKGFVMVSANYKTSQMFDMNQDPELVQKAYTVVNAQLGTFDLGHHYNLTFMANNIFDQLFYVNMSHLTTMSSKTNSDTIRALIPAAARRNFKVKFSYNF